MSTNPLIFQSNATHLPLESGSVDLVFTSPPYADARLYLESGENKGISRNAEAWVRWMLDVVKELTRVCRGLVLINCAGVTRDRNYWPVCEGLCWEWFKAGGNLWRPAYWYRVGIPGSGGRQWLRADVEYILCFKRDAEWLPWADNTANGHPPKWAPGGEMSHRISDGSRVNQWGKNGSRKGMGAKKADGTYADCDRPSHRDLIGTTGVPLKNIFGMMTDRPVGTRKQGRKPRSEVYRAHTKSLPDGSDEEQFYTPPVLANPGTLVEIEWGEDDCNVDEQGNLVRVKVGGGLLGHPMAHCNEAPFPSDLCKWFIRGWCLGETGIVLDPFMGSGTTLEAARALGRRSIGCDIRASQVELTRKRLAQVVPERKPKSAKEEATLFGATL